MKHLHFGKKKHNKKVEEEESIEETGTLDVIQDQLESPDTSIHCKESIKEDNLKDVRKNPELYIEINMLRKIRIVDNFFISANTKTFKYKDKTYTIDEERIYFLPTKSGYIMPTAFYYELNDKPTSFKQLNTGITCKALSLLYKEDLYKDLFSEDVNKYNFIIVVLLVISLIGYAGGLYLYFT